MAITDEEVFALAKLFARSSTLDIAINSAAHEAEVIERLATECGLFSTLRFPFHLPRTDGSLQRDWDFSHRDLEHGGSFLASLAYPDVVELEFVAHVEPWPNGFDPSAFQEST
ncbi:hypothetical protein [Mitsuaria sp. GD03876]|uniref:hypothetical protein n=1 Tax=Mitsuaria sp. GD03876 TaxID=2975399 RepID=UPI00244C83C5|nr:hypothetical protein [Mitsuaria sp. GD03876]MDH0868216.1 hypothetical protein [Mitsuaria sp. GD03876]